MGAEYRVVGVGAEYRVVGVGGGCRVVGVGGGCRVVGVGGEYRVVGVGGGCRVVVVGGGCRVVGAGWWVVGVLATASCVYIMQQHNIKGLKFVSEMRMTSGEMGGAASQLVFE